MRLKGGGSVITCTSAAKLRQDEAIDRRRKDAAERALIEAEARRMARQLRNKAPPVEIDGRSGPEPVRYGDWELKGLAVDF